MFLSMGLDGRFKSLSARRAWIEIRIYDMSAAWNRSLSARRAWIEIVKLFRQNYECFVALRKESVDRNQRIAKPFREQFKSLSARRAWIEIRRRPQHAWL